MYKRLMMDFIYEHVSHDELNNVIIISHKTIGRALFRCISQCPSALEVPHISKVV